jgi:hypothetical protein
MLKELKMIPGIAVIQQADFQVCPALERVFSNTTITTEVNANIVQHTGSRLVELRQDFRRRFVQDLGKDYELIFGSRKSCAGM